MADGDGRVDKVLDDAADIASTTIDQSGEIVSGAGKVLKGDATGGVEHIMKAAGEIATNAVHQGTKIVKDVLGRSDDEAGGEEPAAGSGDDAA